MNNYNPKGLHRDHRGRLLDRYGREMEVDWAEFRQRRLRAGQKHFHWPKVLNPLQASVKAK